MISFLYLMKKYNHSTQYFSEGLKRNCFMRCSEIIQKTTLNTWYSFTLKLYPSFEPLNIFDTFIVFFSLSPPSTL